MWQGFVTQDFFAIKITRIAVVPGENIIELTTDARAAGRRTRIGYLVLGPGAPGEQTVLAAPRLVSYGSAKSPVTITANEAVVSSNGEHVYFQDDVKVTREGVSLKIRGEAGVRYKTEFIATRKGASLDSTARAVTDAKLGPVSRVYSDDIGKVGKPATLDVALVEVVLDRLQLLSPVGIRIAEISVGVRRASPQLVSVRQIHGKHAQG